MKQSRFIFILLAGIVFLHTIFGIGMQYLQDVTDQEKHTTIEAGTVTTWFITLPEKFF